MPEALTPDAVEAPTMPASEKAKPSSRQIELDFIRGIAILLVVDYHGWSPLTAIENRFGEPALGWLGVNLFFVLSGFLVGGLLMKEWKVRGQIDSRRFLIRRGFKIWPQYYAFLLLNVLSRHRTFRQTWSNFLNIQNYTGSIAHTWSLAVEEHFYILLTLCLWVAARRHTRVRNLLYFLLALCVIELPVRWISIAMNYTHLDTATHTRIDGLCYGVILAMIFHFWPNNFAKLRSQTWAWLLLIALCLTIYHFGPALREIRGLDYLASNLIVTALFLLLYRPQSLAKHTWLYRLVAWIGVYSYGIYLWHVSLLAPAMSLHARIPAFPVYALHTLFIAGSIALGVITTRLVEFPMLRLREHLFPNRVDSAVGIPAVIEVEVLAADSAPSGP